MVLREPSPPVFLLVSTEGEVWRSHRRAISPAFKPAFLRALTPVFERHVLALVDRVLAGRDTDRWPLHALLCKLAVDIIGEAAFDVRLGCATSENESEDNVYHATQTSMYEILARIKNPTRETLNIPARWRLERARKGMRSTVQAAIDRKRAAPIADDDHSILAFLLRSGGPGPDQQADEAADADYRLTDEEIIDESVTFLVCS